MTGRSNKPGFASRPADVERWIKAPDVTAEVVSSTGYCARLTIDVTPQLRARIKITAFRQGVTVADLLRALLSETFPLTEDDAP